MTIEQETAATAVTIPAQQAPQIETPAAPAPAARFDGGPTHAHTVRCYWDYRECHWQCAP